ncbi:hypothetical protein JNL27_01190 [bacterium]|nr:hypothetical protein [bacterium]
MKSLTLDKRTVFVITGTNEKSISEAKFKLAGLKFGYGRLDQARYWSLPFENSILGFEILKTLFNNVKRIY